MSSENFLKHFFINKIIFIAKFLKKLFLSFNQKKIMKIFFVGLANLLIKIFLKKS